MSRIGNAPITVPSGVDVSVDGATVSVKGPKGELSTELHDGITASVDEGVVSIDRSSDERSLRALHGLNRSLVTLLHCSTNRRVAYATQASVVIAVITRAFP